MSTIGGPEIVSDGLVFLLDAANTKSYPGSGTSITDVVGNVSGDLINGPTFDSANNGSIVFDGVNDYIDCNNISSINSLTSLTISIWCKKDDSGDVVGVNTIKDVSNDKILLYNWTNNTVYFGVRNGATNGSPAYALSHDSNYHNYTGVYKGGISLEL